jgi:hypothetical protein
LAVAPAAHNFPAARPIAYGGHAAAVRGSAPNAGVGRTAGALGARGRPFGPGYGHPVHWGGGYWGGRFWPGAYYGPGFAWFLATIPLYCATFWWNSIPYYYYNDIYYTWSPAADGYVATDPPPAVPSAPPNASDGSYPSDGSYGAAGNADGSNPAAPPASSASDAVPPGDFPVYPGAAASDNDHVYAYPANGQSEQRQAADRAQCDQWAASQTGGASGSPEYRRAVIACFQGRGYSAQ